jgi:hypothetical protein
MAKKKEKGWRPPSRAGGHDGFGEVEHPNADSVHLGVNLSQIPLPEREYEADVLWPIIRHGAVSLVLDRLSLSGNAVESRVEIRLPLESFLGFWSTTQAEPFAGKFKKWLSTATAGFAARSDDHMGPRSNGDFEARAVLRAQIIRVAHVGTDADLSFYSVPPGYMSMAMVDQSAKRVPIAAVLRVTTTTRALARLLVDCASIVDQVETMMKVEVPT